MKAISILGRLSIVLLTAFSSGAYAQSQEQMLKSTISGSLPATLSKKDLDAFYSQISYRPLFVNGTVTRAKLAELQDVVLRIERHGLKTADYQRPEINMGAGMEVGSSWAIVELNAAQTLINMARHVSVGRVNPSSISTDIKFDQRSFSLAQIYSLASIANGSSIDSVIDGVSSQTTEYWNLMGIRSHLMDIRARGGWADIVPPQKVLKTGVSDPKVIALKERLRDYGYLVSDMSPVYDQQTFSNIVDMQKAYQINQADGMMSASGPTWKIVRTSLAARMDEVDMNLEKIRWLPINLEDRHIFVNLAFQQFRLMDKNLSAQRGMDPSLPYMEFRTINGRKERKTPSMKDRITNVIFNPNWTVPGRIFMEDKLPVIKNLFGADLANYFNDGGYIVLQSDVRTQIDPLSIDWMNMTKENVNIYIRQTPRYNNALGVVKFMMENPWAIYLHDTNTRDVFAKDNDRQQSSGCIRVERPMDLAEYLIAGVKGNFLSGNPASARAEIENFVMKPGETRAKETQLNLPKDRYMPVYSVYQTVVLGRDGVMRFASDSYSQNNQVKAALKKVGFLK